MVLSMIILLLQISNTPAPSDAIGPPLWRETRDDMTPEQFVEVVRKVDGVASAEAIRRKGHGPKIKISYKDGKGVPIGAMAFEVQPSFVNDRLQSITLSQKICYSTAMAQLTTTLEALGEKYPHSQRVKVIDNQGVSVDTQRAFYNDETRVTVSETPVENPYPTHHYGGSGLAASLNSLANSIADQAYSSAINACPNDAGRRAIISLEYRSQAKFSAEHLQEEAARKAKANATKDGL